jgi:nesprin-1
MEQEELERNRNAVAAAAADVGEISSVETRDETLVGEASSDSLVTRSQVSKTGQLVRRTVLQNGRQVSVEEREEPASDNGAAARQLQQPQKRSRVYQIPSPFGIVEEPVATHGDSGRQSAAGGSRDDDKQAASPGRYSVEITDVTDEYAQLEKDRTVILPDSSDQVDDPLPEPVDEVVEIQEILDDMLPVSSVDQTQPDDDKLAASIVEVTEEEQTDIRETLVRQPSILHETLHEEVEEETDEATDKESLITELPSEPVAAPTTETEGGEIDWNILPEVDRHFEECFAGELANDQPVVSDEDDDKSTSSSSTSGSTDTTHLGSTSNSLEEVEVSVQPTPTSIQPEETLPVVEAETAPTNLAEKLSHNLLEDALKESISTTAQPETISEAVEQQPVVVLQEVQSSIPQIESIQLEKSPETDPVAVLPDDNIKPVDDPLLSSPSETVHPEVLVQEEIKVETITQPDQVVEREIVKSTPEVPELQDLITIDREKTEKYQSSESSDSSESEEEKQVIQLAEKVVDILPDIVNQLVKVEHSLVEEVSNKMDREEDGGDDAMEHRGSVAPTLGENTPGPPPPDGDAERELLEHVVRLAVSTAHPAMEGASVEDDEQTAQQAELNIQWQEIQSLLADRLDQLRQDASSSTHSSTVRYLATVTQVTVEESVEERIVKLQDNLAALKTAVQSREVVVIQRIVITIVRTVTEWLETIEYRVYTIKQTKSMERRTEQIQSLSEQVRVVEESLHTVKIGLLHFINFLYLKKYKSNILIQLFFISSKKLQKWRWRWSTKRRS